LMGGGILSPSTRMCHFLRNACGGQATGIPDVT
jgi:hypothetical protein